MFKPYTGITVMVVKVTVPKTKTKCFRCFDYILHMYVHTFRVTREIGASILKACHQFFFFFFL